jgi:putative ABC transport system substrate-binding protein
VRRCEFITLLGGAAGFATDVPRSRESSLRARRDRVKTNPPRRRGMRAFIAAIALWIVGMPAAVQAEQPKRLPQVGFLFIVPRADYDPAKDPLRDALLEGLKALGYVEGKNIHVDYRVPRKLEEVVEMARDLVGHKVDVIATAGPLPIEATRRATDSIPIVIIACDRADRLVASIARPGGNITGMACVSSDLAAKRLQLLQEIVPRLSRVAVLFNGAVPAKVAELQDTIAAAKTMEIEVQSADVRDASGFTTVFAAIKGGNPQALIALAEPLTFTHVKEIAEFAAEQRLPSTYGFREFCDAGGLLCYGTNLSTDGAHAIAAEVQRANTDGDTSWMRKLTVLRRSHSPKQRR